MTIEPILDFDMSIFVDMFRMLKHQRSLEYVWIGFDSKGCDLPEPSQKKTQYFINKLREISIKVRGKKLINKHGEIVVI